MIITYSVPHWFFFRLWTWVSGQWQKMEAPLFAQSVDDSPKVFDALFYTQPPKVFEVYVYDGGWNLVRSERNWVS